MLTPFETGVLAFDHFATFLLSLILKFSEFLTFLEMQWKQLQKKKKKTRKNMFLQTSARTENYV